MCMLFICVLLFRLVQQKKKKKKKKKTRFNQICFFLLCTAINAFGRLTINICHWHFLLWRYFLRVKCAAISIRLFLYGIFHTVSVIKLYKLCNHFMYPFVHFMANMGFRCRTLIYTPLAGLQSSFCHWRFFLGCTFYRLQPYPYVHFCMAYYMLYQLSYNSFMCTFMPIHIYTPLAGLQSSFCHWRFLFRLYLLKVAAISMRSFLYGILYVVSVII